MLTVLDLLKQSECGLTKKELRKKARVERIAKPIQKADKYVAQGKARFDKNPPPGRYKAMPSAWPK